MRLFVTGAAGFIGSNYVRWLLANSDDRITIFDKLTYAGNMESIRDLVDDRRCRFVHLDRRANGRGIRYAGILHARRARKCIRCGAVGIRGLDRTDVDAPLQIIR